jgi:hypothetical protein
MRACREGLSPLDGVGGIGWDGGVPEYDAFGREVKEQARPEAAVVVEPEPPRPVALRRRARVEWPRGRAGGVAGWLVLLAFLGAALVGVGTSVESGSQSGPIGPAIEAPAPAAGVNGASLIRERNFAEAVDALSRAGLGRPLTLRVAPDRIDAALLDQDRVHHVRVTPGGELVELATTAAPPTASARRTVAYDAIDVSAPRRLVRAGATRRTPARRIDYLVLTPGPPTTWSAYFKGGRIVVGDAHGHKRRTI